MAIEEVTKAQLLSYMEDDDSLQYMGDATHNFGDGSKLWAIYRTAIGAGDEPRGYKVVRFDKS